MPESERHETPIAWEGDSRTRLRSFPEDVRADLGIDLQRIQWGEEPASYRSMPSIGQGVYELRQQDERAWYRVIYLTKIANRIHVLHCFEKKTRKTPRRDLKTASARLAVVRQRLLEQKREANRDRGNHGKAD